MKTPLATATGTAPRRVSAQRPSVASKTDSAAEPETLPVRYPVQPGDTLSSIARETTGDIANAKHLHDLNRDVLGPDGNKLTPGLELRLPKGANPGGSWLVTDGETFTRIAEHALGDPSRARELVELNWGLVGGKPETLKAGMHVRLPGPARLGESSFERGPTTNPGLNPISTPSSVPVSSEGPADSKLAGEASARLRGASVHGAKTRRATGRRGDELSTVDRIIDTTARHEGNGRYDAWNPNDGGKGVSFGLVQFNQKVGELPKLLGHMHEQNPEKFREIFGKDAQWLATDEKRVRRSNLKPMKEKFQAAAEVPEFQQAQRDLARDLFFNEMAKSAKEHGVRTERGLAMLFDASIQLGVQGAKARLRQAARGSKSEDETLTRFATSADKVKWANHRRHKILKDPEFAQRTIDVDALLDNRRA